MEKTAFNSLGDVLAGAFQLQAEVFRFVSEFSGGLIQAILIVLLAGLSLAIGQSIVLFINRVKPGRFIFSLILSAILYTFGFLFLVFSTWLICLFSRSIDISLGTLTKVFGLSYAPFLFSFLGALPYLGYPILTILSVWRLLAMVIGFSAVANVETGTAFAYLAIGWFILQLLENTIGQPIARLGKAIADRVAGVDLISSRKDLNAQVKAGLMTPASPILSAVQVSPVSLPEVRQFVQASYPTNPQATQTVIQAIASQSSPFSSSKVRQIDSADPLVQLNQRTASIPGSVKLALSLLGMTLLFIIVAVLLEPIRDSVFGWHANLPDILQLLFDLVWIGVIALVFAGLLAPLESLGWWAGWYDDEVDVEAIAPPPAPTSQTASDVNQPSRYIVYLDGICQSGEEYTPDVEDFLAALEPTLPKGMVLVRGLMMYSVLNKPLVEDRPLAFLWKLADQMRWDNPAALLGIMVNLRNVLIVAVSADKRYGPIYNQGIAQVIYNGLIERGYPPRSGIPITLIGYSGGGEMSVAAAPYLKRAIAAPIDVISLGGVMSANNNLLMLEQLYHLVGEKDTVEILGPIMFPGRWKLFPLSYWNRAKRKGNISIISLGPVGHQLPGGIMDPNAFLPDGRSYMQQTIEIIVQILQGTLVEAQPKIPKKLSNYQLYKQADFNRPAYYPLNQTVDLTWYRPIGQWMGRLILPQRTHRAFVQGALLEVHHTPLGQESLVGKLVRLQWADTPAICSLLQVVTRDVHFSADSEYSSEYGGAIHPGRINHWLQVGPLESLAGSLPADDMIVMLQGEVLVETGNHASASDTVTSPSDSRLPATILRISQEPVQITGRYYAIVRFLEPIAETDRFRVVHFNPTSRQFDGLQETVRLPEVTLAQAYGSFPSTTRDIEKSPFNETGWYIYGAKDAQGLFVVQSWGPRSLFRLQPDEVIFGQRASYQYIRKQSWANVVAQKGKISSVLCTPRDDTSDAIEAAIDQWRKPESEAFPEGTRALLIHTYGGIGGKNKEPAAATPIFFGHFAYGLAQVVWEPLANELRFDLRYYQVYTQNTDGLVAGTLHWSRYMGDRQFGWLGTRPVCDILIRLDAFTGYFDVNGRKNSALDVMLRHLQVMTARYRIGDGTGGTFVGVANNCSQDSNQALFASIQGIEKAVSAHAASIQDWLSSDPEQAQRFRVLMALGQDLKEELQAFGAPRSDWEDNDYNLGCTLEDQPLRNLWFGLGSWRTLLPRLASDTVVKTFLQHGAAVWVLRTNQVGGNDPDIAPIAPMTL
jgi:predicted Abi (CAAX) family protease